MTPQKWMMALHDPWGMGTRWLVVAWLWVLQAIAVASPNETPSNEQRPLTGIRADAPPADPQWPTRFRVAFTEVATGLLPIGGHVTDGDYVYDFTVPGKTVTRYPALHCTSWQHWNGECSTTDLASLRSFRSPERRVCCACCSNRGGCGVLKPDWLSGATFLGRKPCDDRLPSDLADNQCFEWDQPGLQSNLYWDEANEERRPRRILQQPNDDMVFNMSTYAVLQSVDRSLFQVPDYCLTDQGTHRACPWLSLCTVLG